MRRKYPFTQDDFASLMAGLGLSPGDGPFAVAVSGGPDSMALSLLMAGWGDTTYLTFDHGLRKESAGEARQVGKWLTKRGLSHHILAWEGKKPKSDIQAAARAARYRALETWCRENGVNYLLLAHTQDDQAETFLIRLFRGSGVDGLSAMAPISLPNTKADGPRLVRPLLGVLKSQLVDYLKNENQNWILDPSNENTDFTRIKIRQMLAASDIEGFDAETLAKTAARMTRVKKVLERETGTLLASALELFPEGYGRLDHKCLLEADEEIGLRALSKVLMMIGGGAYPQRLASLQRLYESLGRKDFKGATLAGCQVMTGKDGVLLICREPADISDEITLKGGESGLWDGRFEVALSAGSGVVRKLGEEGWNALTCENPDLKKVALPYEVKIGLPARMEEKTVHEVPGLGFFAGKQSLTARFLHLGEKPSDPLAKQR